MCSRPQNHHKSTPRSNSAIIPNSSDIKKHVPNLTEPPESLEYSKIQFENSKIKMKLGKLGIQPAKLGAP